MKSLLVVLSLVILIEGCGAQAMPNNPGGQSQVSYIQQIKSGLIFSEGFENDNFVSAESWTTVQGVAQNSSNQYKQGIKSFLCNGTASTLSIISKTLPSGVACITWWFYDDGTTSGQGPYGKVLGSSGNYYQIGIRNNVSTTNYVLGGPSQDVFGTTTSIARTTAWHFVKVILLSGNILILLDGNIVLNTGEASTSFSKVFVCSGTTADAGTAFGFFDSVFCFSSNTGTVLIGDGQSRQVNLYDQNWNLLNSSSGTSISVNPSSANLFPTSIFIQISSASNFNTVEYTSPLIFFNLGDVLKYSDINFGRKVELPDYVPDSYQLVNTSPTGNLETLVTGQKDKLKTTITQLQGFGWTQLIRNWYQYAVTGAPYSIMTDNNFDNAFGVNSASVAARGQTITIMPNLSTNPTDAFNTNALTNTNGVLSYANNYIYTIRNYAGTKKQTVTVASKTGTTLTFNETLNFALAQGDYIYSEYFFPFLEIDGADLSGFTLYDKNIPSYNWVQKHKEYINT